MLDEAKTSTSLVPVQTSDEISTAALLEQLAQFQGWPLVFRYEGRDVLPSYHVTEVKSASFEALDCGANFETWHETFIQLWDVPGDSREFMPVAKFLAIIGKVAERVPFDVEAKLTFEVSDGINAIQLYRASSIEVAKGGLVRVELTRRPASCKPRDRWLEQTSCCGPSARSARCCT
jgi:hypothetical protein